jgi:hypothetical protein
MERMVESLMCDIRRQVAARFAASRDGKYKRVLFKLCATRASEIMRYQRIS